MIDEKTLRNMRLFGGSFVVKLAELYLYADERNREKLEKCFKEYFEEYEHFGR